MIEEYKMAGKKTRRQLVKLYVPYSFQLIEYCLLLLQPNNFIYHQSLDINQTHLESRKMTEEENTKKEKVKEKVIKIRDTGGDNSEEVIAKRSSSSE